jgi:hypothetical protein
MQRDDLAPGPDECAKAISDSINVPALEFSAQNLISTSLLPLLPADLRSLSRPSLQLHPNHHTSAPELTLQVLYTFTMGL